MNSPIINSSDIEEEDLSRVTTLVELLRYRASKEPNRIAFTFLHNGEQPLEPLTYGGLDRRARTIAAWLSRRNAYGHCAILIQKAGYDFLAAYMGCLYAGVVPVALVSPHLSSKHFSMEIFQGVAAETEARFLFADPLILNQREKVETEFGVHIPEWVDLVQVLADVALADTWSDPGIQSSDVAHLQYTSGSTGKPKGILITHHNLLSNLDSIAYRYNRNTITVSWLPHFHDMGLIKGLLQPIYSGFECYFMSPAAFVQKPIRWLQAISDYKATHVTAPNFAYELCLRRVKPEQLARFDLSSLQAVISGAEPVRWGTLVKFGQVFEPAGLRFETFHPGYGLAEATLGVTTKAVGVPPHYLNLDLKELQANLVREVSEGHSSELKVVACGELYKDTRVAIVDPTTHRQVEPDQVGEIWVQGPGVTPGYFNQPELTEQTFNAYLANGEGPFLRTGDLGFMQGGDLFISGRRKDLIIIRGRNHWPQDLERTVEEALPDLFKNDASAAFSIELNNEERLVIAAEVRPDVPPFEVEVVEEAVRHAIAERHELNLYELVLLKREGLPRTTSGKVQRQAARVAWLENTLEKYLG